MRQCNTGWRTVPKAPFGKHWFFHIPLSEPDLPPSTPSIRTSHLPAHGFCLKTSRSLNGRLPFGLPLHQPRRRGILKNKETARLPFNIARVCFGPKSTGAPRVFPFPNYFVTVKGDSLGNTEVPRMSYILHNYPFQVLNNGSFFWYVCVTQSGTRTSMSASVWEWHPCSTPMC